MTPTDRLRQLFHGRRRCGGVDTIAVRRIVEHDCYRGRAGWQWVEKSPWRRAPPRRRSRRSLSTALRRCMRRRGRAGVARVATCARSTQARHFRLGRSRSLTCEVAPGDNWMIHVAVEQCQPGDILVVDAHQSVRGRLLRRAAGGLPARARRARPDHGRRRARRRRAHRDGVPGVVEGRLRPGHGQGDDRQRATCPSSAPARWCDPGDVDRG